LNKTCFEAHLKLGELYLDKQNLPKALQYLKNAKTLEP
jgi:hypothetical protein